MNSHSDFNPQDTKSTLDYKYCEFCMVPIPRSQEIPYCPACQEKIIFHHVKEYIRENDVNEFQVADHFNIPLRMVKNWIKEGRIEGRSAGGSGGRGCPHDPAGRKPSDRG